MLISKQMNKPTYKTIYVISRGNYANRNYWCFLDEIFFSKKEARKYCTVHNVSKYLIKKITLREKGKKEK